MTAKVYGPVGIVDIGSNSVRFVAYGGAARVPSTLFNEKVTASLGRGLAKDGNIDAESAARALSALARFERLARDMGLKKLHTVATAAVRDAANGTAFLKDVAALGLRPRLLPGDEEAELSGLGVVSGIPRANGVVADLGGGSLELVGVARGAAGEGVSLPLGVLRVGSAPDGAAIRKTIISALKSSRLADAARGHGLYLVGGSFRALAQLDLREAGHPLPIVHQHRFSKEQLDRLELLVAKPAAELKSIGRIAASRVGALPAALAVLRATIDVLAPRKVVVSAFGLREGLLYRELDGATRAQDPLLAAALEVGERLGRFGDHGAALDAWIAPLFPDDDGAAQRLRLAACLLGDIAWNAHPDFRSERAIDLALHGNWVGIDAHGRIMLARALGTAFGGESGFGGKLLALLKPGEDERAIAWGRAIRLAQRLSAGTEGTLRRSSIALDKRRIVLTLPSRHRALYAETVERRLLHLGKAMAAEIDVTFA